MPVKTVKRGTKYRVVEASSGRIARNPRGTPVDGGGHASRERAAAQARAVNSSNSKRRRSRK